MLSFLALASPPQIGVTSAHRERVRPPNVIVVVLDDVGVDQLGIHGATPAWGESLPRTPVIDQLRASGVLFQHAYSAPLCSPSRAMLLTGRHGFRTGMLNLSEESGPCPPGLVFQGATACCPADDPTCQLAEPSAPLHPLGYSLRPTEITIAEALVGGVALVPTTYACGAFGKWHLGRRPGDPCEAIEQGFEIFQGHLFNNEGGSSNHYAWRREDARRSGTICDTQSSDVVGRWDGETTASDARAWIDSVRSEPEPRAFFAYVCFNPPHRPFQVPPRSLVSPETWTELEHAQLATEMLIVDGVRSCNPVANQEVDSRNARLAYKAALEGVDALIGKLVFEAPDQPAILENTVVFVLGDNGTPDQVYQATRDSTEIAVGTAPYLPNHAKPNIYELGVHVPLVVTGPNVAVGGTCSALVSLVDLWSTITDLARIDTSNLIASEELDSRSFAPWLRRPAGPVLGGRDFVYTELASRNGMSYVQPTHSWSPVAPIGTVNYQRAIIEANGFKYLRRTVGFDPGCSSALLCGQLPGEEIYRLFDGATPIDPTEVHDCCGESEALQVMTTLRAVMSETFSGN